jgi:predicted amidohydrolase
VRIAVAQTPGSDLRQWRQTLALVEELICRAAAGGAELVVLPECVFPAYYLGSMISYFAARQQHLPGAETFVERISALAREKRIAVCAGYVEEHGRRLFNSACLIDRDGELLGVHRKVFLWDFDHDWFAPGESIIPIKTRFGPVGIMICADARLPEIPATLVARGARLLLQPTAWVNMGGPERLWNPQPEFLIAERARELGVPIASASRWGPEGSALFVGSSLICDRMGQVLVEAPSEGNHVIFADVEVSESSNLEVTPAERGTLGLTWKQEIMGEPPGVVRLLPLPASATDEQVAAFRAQQPAGGQPVLAFAPAGCGSRGGGPLRLGVDWLVLRGPSDGLLHLENVCVGAIAAPDATRFAPCRCLALLGIHIVVVFGSEASMPSLRARACENRIFVLAVSSEAWQLIDPAGCPVLGGSWPSSLLTADFSAVDLGPASDKEAAPRTNILADRHPQQYLL